MEKRHFSIVISQLRADKLPKGNLFAKCDPYIKVHWPGASSATTPPIPKAQEPVWAGWDASFQYEEPPYRTEEELLKQLSKSQFVLECYAKRSFRDDTLIGRVSVDLLTLLAGPPDQSHTLQSTSGGAGMIMFRVEVRCERTAAFQLKCVTCYWQKPRNYGPLFCTTQLGENEATPSSICFATHLIDDPFWVSCPRMTQSASMKELLGETIRLAIHSANDEERLGECLIPLKKYLQISKDTSEPTFFREPLYAPNAVPRENEEGELVQPPAVALIEGFLSGSRLPLPCQMVQGVNQDGVLEETSLLYPGLFDFTRSPLKRKLQRPKPPVDKGYHAELEPSPHEVPHSAARETELEMHLMQLIARDVEWKQHETSLRFLGENLQHDCMSKDIFFRHSGISVLRSCVDFYLQQADFTELISMSVLAADIFFHSIHQFPRAMSMLDSPTLRMMIQLITMNLEQDDGERHAIETILQAFLIFSQHGSRERDLLVNQDAIEVFIKCIPDHADTAARCIQSLAHVLPIEQEKASREAISADLVEKRAVTALLESAVSENDDVVTVNLSPILLKCLHTIAALSHSLRLEILHFIFPLLGRATTKDLENLVLLVEDVQDLSLPSESPSDSVELNRDSLQALCRLLSAKGESETLRMRVGQILASLTSTRDEHSASIREELFRCFSLSLFVDVEEVPFGLSLLHMLGSSADSVRVISDLLLPNFECLFTLAANSTYADAVENTLVDLCRQHRGGSNFSEILEYLTARLQQKQSVLLVLTILNALLPVTGPSQWHEIITWIIEFLWASTDEPSHLIASAQRLLGSLASIPEYQADSIELLSEKLKQPTPQAVENVLPFVHSLSGPSQGADELVESLLEISMRKGEEQSEWTKIQWELLFLLSASPSFSVHHIVGQALLQSEALWERSSSHSFIYQLADQALATTDPAIQATIIRLILLPSAELSLRIDLMERCFTFSALQEKSVAALLDMMQQEDQSPDNLDAFLQACAASRELQLNMTSSGQLVIACLQWMVESYAMASTHRTVIFQLLHSFLQRHSEEGRSLIRPRVLEFLDSAVHFDEYAESAADLLFLIFDALQEHRIVLEKQDGPASPSQRRSTQDTIRNISSQTPSITHRTQFMQYVGFPVLLALLTSDHTTAVFSRLQLLTTMVLNPLQGEALPEGAVVLVAPDASIGPLVECLERAQEVLQNRETNHRVLDCLCDFLSALASASAQEIVQLFSRPIAGSSDTLTSKVVQLLQLQLSQPEDTRLDAVLAYTISALGRIFRCNAKQIHLFSVSQAPLLIPVIGRLQSTANLSLVLNISRLLRAVFADRTIQQQFADHLGFYAMGRAIVRATRYMESSSVAMQALVESIHFLVGTAQVPQLRREILQQYLLPVILHLLEMQVDESLLVPALGFIYYMSQDSDAKTELIDSSPIDHLAVIMNTQRGSPASNAARECFVALGGISFRCTSTQSGMQEPHDELYYCKTCALATVCKFCVKVCHADHNLSPITRPNQSVVCSCGASPYCLIKETPSLRVQYPLRLCSVKFTGRAFAFQSWFFCRTCFRDMQRGVCYTCSQICHRGHDLRYGNDSRFFCDCHERYAEVCRCQQPREPLEPNQVPRKRRPALQDITTLDAEEAYPQLVAQNPHDADRSEKMNFGEDNLCVVCMDGEKEALFYPCGHIVSCMECACLLKQRNEPCSICRKPITDVVRTYRV